MTMYYDSKRSRFAGQVDDLGRKLIEASHILKVEIYKTDKGLIVGDFEVKGQFSNLDGDVSTQVGMIHSLLNDFADAKLAEDGEDLLGGGVL